MTQQYRSALLWAGLLAASSPTIVNLIEGIPAEASHRYTLLALLLLMLLVIGATPAPARPDRRTGLLLLGIGLLVQLFGAATSSWSIARVGLPVAILGVGSILGRPSPATLLLAFGLVPVPSFVFGLGSPAIESAYGELTGALLASLGATIEVGGPLLESGVERFELLSTDSGLVTAICLAEFAWYRSVRRGRSILTALLRATVASVAGFVAQPALVLGGAATLVLGFPEVGRFLLSYGVALGLGLLALAGEVRGIGR